MKCPPSTESRQPPPGQRDRRSGTLLAATIAALALHAGALATLASGWQPPTAPPMPPAGGSTTTVQLRTLPERLADHPPTSSRPDLPVGGPLRRDRPAPLQPDPGAEDTGPIYRPNATLARPALPYSEPDWSLLEGVPASGLPVRLRLLVNAQGGVDTVEPLQVGPDDTALLQRLQQALLATRFIPGREGGVDVPAAIELLFEPGVIEVSAAVATAGPR